MRSCGICVICGDPREIVSRGKCAKCLMKERREAERRGEPVHNPAEYTYLKELNKYLGRFVKAATALEDGAIPETFISTADHQTLRRIIRESIDGIQAKKKTLEVQGIIPMPEQSEDGALRLEAIEKVYSPEEITDAEGLIASEVGAMQNGERPGRYYAENQMGEYNPQREQGASKGVTAGGHWYGVGSGRNMFPFMREHPEWSAAALGKALRNKDSALYKRAIAAAVDFIKSEAEAERAAIQAESQAESADRVADEDEEERPRLTVANSVPDMMAKPEPEKDGES